MTITSIQKKWRLLKASPCKENKGVSMEDRFIGNQSVEKLRESNK